MDALKTSVLRCVPLVPPVSLSLCVYVAHVIAPLCPQGDVEPEPSGGAERSAAVCGLGAPGPAAGKDFHSPTTSTL